MRFKKSQMIPIFIIGIFLFTFSILYADISKSEAIDIVVNQIVREDIDNVIGYMTPEIYTDNYYILNDHKSLLVSCH